MVDLLGKVALLRRGPIAVQALRHRVHHGEEQLALIVELPRLGLTGGLGQTGLGGDVGRRACHRGHREQHGESHAGLLRFKE